MRVRHQVPASVRITRCLCTLAACCFLPVSLAVAESRDAPAQQVSESFARTAERPDSQALRQLLEDGNSFPTRYREFIHRFYAGVGYQPAWVSQQRRDAALVLLRRMADAEADGLCSANYNASDWIKRLDAGSGYEGPSSGDSFAATDVNVTAAIVRYAVDLALGMSDKHSSRDLDVVDTLLRIHDSDSAHHALARLEPQHAEYGALRAALRTYRRIAERGGWLPIPDGLVLRARNEDAASGDALDGGQLTSEEHEAILRIAQRLVMTGDLNESTRYEAGDSARYDAVLEHAVRRFQERHGLQVDGIVGPRTTAAFNVPVEVRVRQLATNMDRWRYMPDDLGSRYVFVNIPAFELRAVENGNAAATMAVVTGKVVTPTPLMNDDISYLVFRPYWNVPDSITRNELLPKLADDPDLLIKERFEVVDGWGQSTSVVDPQDVVWDKAQEDFPYRLRQEPGAQNALGLVKFMFPNKDNIYLHDTPSQQRFRARRRAYSHGCVRVENPVALADFLLRDHPDWTEHDIRAAMASGDRQIVSLKRSVPVYLSYFTTWAEGGKVEFRDDVYGLDRSNSPSTECSGS